MLAEGTLTLSVLCLIAPLLSDHPGLLESVKGKAKRDVELLIAPLGAPRHVPDRIRPLTVVAPAPAGPDLFSAQESVEQSQKEESSEPTAPEAKPSSLAVRTKLEFRFVADEALLEGIVRLRQLLWHKHPAGRLEDVLLVAVRDYVARNDPAREVRLAAACVLGDPKSRRVPARVRRIVWRRDEGRCAFVGPAGRCEERRSLEIDHVVPWALGGRSDDPSNLRLLCRAHNRSEAERIFGRILPGEKNVDN